MCPKWRPSVGQTTEWSAPNKVTARDSSLQIPICFVLSDSTTTPCWTLTPVTKHSKCLRKDLWRILVEFAMDSTQTATQENYGKVTHWEENINISIETSKDLT